MITKPVEQAGFTYIYLSNESNTTHDVYFDDLRITHTKSKIQQEDHYYPFGLGIAALSSTAPLSKPNNYKYNGKEEQTDFDLNSYDYGWRMFDPTIARWNRVDGMAEKYLSFSPYHYAANNPISNYDIDGNEFTEASWSYIKGFIDEINRRTDSNNKAIDKAQAKIDAGVSDKKRKRLEKRIERRQNSNKTLDGTRGEIAELIASDQVYNIVSSDKFSQGSGMEKRDVASTLFNVATDQVDIILPKSGGLGFLSHELLHAYQFDKGEISLPLHLRLNTISPLQWLTYDLEDEKAGDARADFFGSRTKSSTATEHLNRTLGGQRFGDRTFQMTIQNLTIYSSHARRQQLANESRQAFRIDGRTYKPQN